MSKFRAVERVEDAAEADERVLDHLANLGCDPTAPRMSNHYLYFRTAERAEDVAEHMRADGWATAIRQSEGVWLIVATHVTCLTLRHVRDTRRRLETLSSQNGGLYDGWEASIN